MEASVDLNVKNEIEENLDIDESSSKNEKSLFLEEVEFQSIQDIKELTKSSLETWKEEYLFRLKRIFKNDIEKCAQSGKCHYIHETGSMDLYKARVLKEAIINDIGPMLQGYDLRCETKTKDSSKSLATIIIAISWM